MRCETQSRTSDPALNIINGSRFGAGNRPSGPYQDAVRRPGRAAGPPPEAGALLVVLVLVERRFRSDDQKSMPPMPPMSPPGIAGAFSGLSATTASVVRNSAAIDAAFWRAERVTLAGSMMPSAIMST